MKAIRLNPQHADAYRVRGAAREAQGDAAGAIAEFEQYLELSVGLREVEQEEVEQHIRALGRIVRLRAWLQRWF
jgi:hypothetical protein